MKPFILALVFTILNSLAMGQINKKPPVLNSNTYQTQNKIPIIQPGQVPPPPPPGQNPPQGQVPPPPPPGQNPPQGQVPPPPPLGQNPPQGQVPPPPPPGQNPPQGQVPPPPPPGQSPIIPNLNNLQKVLTTSTEIKPYLRPGKIWATKTPNGEIDLKAAIMYDNYVIATIHFNPCTGQILPEGYNAHCFNLNTTSDQIQNSLNSLIRHITILNAAEYREPESSWAVPITYQGMIIAHIKIYYTGEAIVPDYPAQQELAGIGYK